MEEVRKYNPLEEWSDKTLKRKFENMYENVYILKEPPTGVSYHIQLNAMLDEMEERGINPEKVVEHYR